MPLKRKRGSRTDLSTIAMECLQEVRKSNEAIAHADAGPAGVDLDADGTFGQHRGEMFKTPTVFKTPTPRFFVSYTDTDYLMLLIY